MPLLKLPPEVLQLIITQLPSQASLATLARVCRHLESLVDPILYRTIYLRNHDDTCLIRALESRPERAQHPRELQIHYHYVDVPNQTEYYPLLVESLLPTLSRLVNLKRLTVKGLLYDSCRMIMDDVPYDPERRTELWSFDSRSSVVVHPHLKELSLVGAVVDGLGPDLEYEPRSTPLESLTLLCCDVSAAGMGQLLSVPKALKHLTWKGVPAVNPPDFWPADRMSYIQMIRTQADSLVSLDLDLWAPIHQHPPLDLRALRCLRQLTVDPNVFRRADVSAQECVLPGSLQKLVLRAYREYSLPDLGPLALVYGWVSSGALPSLGCVTVQSARFQAEKILGAVFRDGGSFEDAFRSIGVQLEYERVRPSVEEEHFAFDCPCCAWALRWNNGLDW
ncbi:F-box protein [Aspergillus saccharolyticus JOP 1030-1]|uniref:F-box domain-containing protein n=1 Tax=Aspergillus saccharolyticus JOP 1030-1 TaxID=1450539 RepID=A0A318ZFT5_9EURO|nr:hypothetical protein BP01DRAFT_316282 [Aspergillus saccharolyticus JOP 1030-1]PYH46416.1 hypothetical protein BP01DRAFT_316282 [Aspergillus saccharolyticus JOP 1030-1]